MKLLYCSFSQPYSSYKREILHWILTNPQIMFPTIIRKLIYVYLKFLPRGLRIKVTDTDKLPDILVNVNLTMDWTNALPLLCLVDQGSQNNWFVNIFATVKWLLFQRKCTLIGGNKYNEVWKSEFTEVKETVQIKWAQKQWIPLSKMYFVRVYLGAVLSINSTKLN